MYRSISKSESDELSRDVAMTLTIKHGWEASVTGVWSAIPCHVVARVGPESQTMFDCYRSCYDGSVDITNLKGTSWFLKQMQGLQELYLKLTVRDLLNQAETESRERLLISTSMPSIYDAFIDYKFKLVPPKSDGVNSIMGYKKLK